MSGLATYKCYEMAKIVDPKLATIYDNQQIKALKKNGGDAIMSAFESNMVHRQELYDTVLETTLKISDWMFNTTELRKRMMKEVADHPLHGRVFKLKNVYDNGSGPENKWISFRDDDLCYRATYEEKDAVPWKFYKVRDKPHVYTIKQMWPDKTYWVSIANNGQWIYGRYTTASDAMPIYFEQLSHNESRTFEGECYRMKNLYTPYSYGHRWIGFANNGHWMRACYYSYDSMTVVLHDDPEGHTYNDEISPKPQPKATKAGGGGGGFGRLKIKARAKAGR